MPQIFSPLLSSNLSDPTGNYIYDLVPVSNGSLSAIASDDSLRIFDASSLSLIAAIPKTHSGGVTALKSVETNILATAGRDGTVKMWDTRIGGGATARVYKKASNAPILSLGVNSGANIIAAGTELAERVASIVIWDLRTAEIKVQYTESHNDDVTELQFHPMAPHLLLSGSTDFLVNVYNLLTPPSTTSNNADDDVDEALHQVVNHGSSIHRAGFLFSSSLPKQVPDIFALSHDENFAMYKFQSEIAASGEGEKEGDEEEKESKGFGDVREGLGCEYVINVIPHKTGGGVLAAGSNGGKWVDLIPLRNEEEEMSGWNLAGKEGVRLRGGHGEEVVRGIWIDDQSGAVFTGGEDGLVKVWRAPNSGDQEVALGGVSSPVAKTSAKRKPGRKEKEEPKGRFRPY